MRGHHIIADPHRVYQAHDQDTLLSEVASVQCVLLPRAVLAAGFSDEGRVLLRPSGTEALVRVMVEAATGEQAQVVADRLADVVRTQLALS